MTIKLKYTNSETINMPMHPLEKLADIISGRINNIIQSPRTLTNITEHSHLKTKESQEYLEYIIEKENTQRMKLATKQATQAVKKLKSTHDVKSYSELALSAKKNHSKIIR